VSTTIWSRQRDGVYINVDKQTDRSPFATCKGRQMGYGVAYAEMLVTWTDEVFFAIFISTCARALAG